MSLLQRLHDAMATLDPHRVRSAASRRSDDHVSDNDQELAQFIEGDDRPETILHLLSCEPCRLHMAWVLDALSSAPPPAAGATTRLSPPVRHERVPALALLERAVDGSLRVAHATCAVRRAESLTVRHGERVPTVWLRDHVLSPRVEIGIVPDRERFHLILQWLDSTTTDADVTLCRERRVLARARLGAASTLIQSIPDGLIHASFSSGDEPALDLWVRLPS